MSMATRTDTQSPALHVADSHRSASTARLRITPRSLSCGERSAKARSRLHSATAVASHARAAVRSSATRLQRSDVPSPRPHVQGLATSFDRRIHPTPEPLLTLRLPPREKLVLTFQAQQPLLQLDHVPSKPATPPSPGETSDASQQASHPRTSHPARRPIAAPIRRELDLTFQSQNRCCSCSESSEAPRLFPASTSRDSQHKLHRIHPARRPIAALSRTAGELVLTFHRQHSCCSVAWPPGLQRRAALFHSVLKNSPSPVAPHAGSGHRLRGSCSLIQGAGGGPRKHARTSASTSTTVRKPNEIDAGPAHSRRDRSCLLHR